MLLFIIMFLVIVPVSAMDTQSSKLKSQKDYCRDKWLKHRKKEAESVMALQQTCEDASLVDTLKKRFIARYGWTISTGKNGSEYVTNKHAEFVEKIRPERILP